MTGTTPTLRVEKVTVGNPAAWEGDGRLAYLESFETTISLPELLHQEEAQRTTIDREKVFRASLRQAVRPGDLRAANLDTERVMKAYDRALKQANYSALEALEREIDRVFEEEEFLLMVLAS